MKLCYIAKFPCGLLIGRNKPEGMGSNPVPGNPVVGGTKCGGH